MAHTPDMPNFDAMKPEQLRRWLTLASSEEVWQLDDRTCWRIMNDGIAPMQHLRAFYAEDALQSKLVALKKRTYIKPELYSSHLRPLRDATHQMYAQIQEGLNTPDGEALSEEEVVMDAAYEHAGARDYDDIRHSVRMTRLATEALAERLEDVLIASMEGHMEAGDRLMGFVKPRITGEPPQPSPAERARDQKTEEIKRRLEGKPPTLKVKDPASPVPVAKPKGYDLSHYSTNQQKLWLKRVATAEKIMELNDVTVQQMIERGVMPVKHLRALWSERHQDAILQDLAKWPAGVTLTGNASLNLSLDVMQHIARDLHDARTPDREDRKTNAQNDTQNAVFEDSKAIMKAYPDINRKVHDAIIERGFQFLAQHPAARDAASERVSTLVSKVEKLGRYGRFNPEGPTRGGGQGV